MKSWKKVLSACLAVLMLTGCSAAPGSSASDTGKENSSASGTESSAADDGWTLAATDPWAAYPETITYTVGKAAPDAGYSGLDGSDAIGKTIHFLGAENAVLHPSDNVPPAGRTNVDGKIIFVHNASPVWPCLLPV